MTRHERIALARATIAGCLHADDQLAPEHEQLLEHPTVVMFRAGCPDSQRGSDLSHDAKVALDRAGFEAWTALVLQHGETRVEIRVVVGEVDRAQAGGAP